jgi:hypothetical protein
MESECKLRNEVKEMITKNELEEKNLNHNTQSQIWKNIKDEVPDIKNPILYIRRIKPGEFPPQDDIKDAKWYVGITYWTVENKWYFDDFEYWMNLPEPPMIKEE